MKLFEMDSNRDSSLVAAWNQNNYNPLISVLLKNVNQVLEPENKDIHGKSLDAR